MSVFLEHAAANKSNNVAKSNLDFVIWQSMIEYNIGFVMMNIHEVLHNFRWPRNCTDLQRKIGSGLENKWISTPCPARTEE
jgi:hypothetical protein